MNARKEVQRRVRQRPAIRTHRRTGARKKVISEPPGSVPVPGSVSSKEVRRGEVRGRQGGPRWPPRKIR